MKIDVTNLTERKKQALGRITYPTKRETAEGHGVYFYAVLPCGTPVWRVFNGYLSPTQEDEVIKLLSK